MLASFISIVCNVIFFRWILVVFVLLHRTMTQRMSSYGVIRQNVVIKPWVIMRCNKNKQCIITRIIFSGPQFSSDHLFTLRFQNKRLVADSPILLMKAIKSEQEREGMRNAHVSYLTIIIIIEMSLFNKHNASRKIQRTQPMKYCVELLYLITCIIMTITIS